MMRGMPKPCDFPALDSGQKGFLWASTKLDLALHPVVGIESNKFDGNGTQKKYSKACTLGVYGLSSNNKSDLKKKKIALASKS